ncbi:MAG TPA: nucleotidyltransferase family protein [Thermoplasmataceae archaeon]|nr:nucleotidyltransferase family protein [Thermoplasmataceae archaeon]
MAACVVLASGLSKRFGDNKLLQALFSRTVLETVICVARSVLPDEVYVVVSPETYGRISHASFHTGVIINKNPDEGIAGSIRTAIQEIGTSQDHILFLLGDQPFVSPNLLKRMVYESQNNPSHIVCAVFQGIRRNPAIFPRHCYSELMALKGDTGANFIIRSARRVIEVEVVNQAELFDIDTPEDLQRARDLIRDRPAWMSDLSRCV